MANASTHAPNWSVILESPGPGKAPYATLTNAVRVLDHDDCWDATHLYFDEFGGRVIYVNSDPREWRDDDDVALTVYMQDMTGMTKIQKHLVADAVDLVARRRSRHPVREYLCSLHWDGIERIAHAFEDYWGADTQPCLYVRAASRNFFIGLVARILRPGCKLDTMPVFEGQQGIFKSSALDALGGAWYAALDESAASKDFLQALRGKWLIELCELNAFSKTESAHIKGMLSRRVDTYRASYGRRTMDIPRQCVFAGTTNHDDWLADDSGGRRFWPIKCGLINVPALAAMRDQLFAEAMVAFGATSSWWEMPDGTVEQQSQRNPYDEIASLILPWVAIQLTYGKEVIAVKDVMMGPLQMTADKLDKPTQMRVASVLKRAGWRRNLKLKVWEPPPATSKN